MKLAKRWNERAHCNEYFAELAIGPLNLNNESNGADLFDPFGK